MSKNNLYLAWYKKTGSNKQNSPKQQKKANKTSPQLSAVTDIFPSQPGPSLSHFSFQYLYFGTVLLTVVVNLQNHYSWKRSLRSSGPTVHLLPFLPTVFSFGHCTSGKIEENPENNDSDCELGENGLTSQLEELVQSKEG